MERVVIGMSGGIDSFVTALMLQQKGCEVIGVTLELWEKNDLTAVGKVCHSLGIPLIYREEKKMFRQNVVEAFIQDYQKGYTPSPCCLCNSYVKWEALNRAAVACNASKIATGHYVRIKKSGEKYYIRKGIDSRKDQSYFLYGISQEILSKAVTPLGDYTKEKVRSWAVNHGYQEMVLKKESMGVCFLRGTDYRDFVRQYGGQNQQPGLIVTREGQPVGEHNGLLNYTIGQKRGMPVLHGESLYVAAMEPERNILVADVKAGLFAGTLWVEDVLAVSPEDLQAEDITVKIRGIGLNPQGTVKIHKLPGNKVKVELSDPAWAVAPGQPVVFFRGDCVIGGGIAMRSESLLD